MAANWDMETETAEPLIIDRAFLAKTDKAGRQAAWALCHAYGIDPGECFRVVVAGDSVFAWRYLRDEEGHRYAVDPWVRHELDENGVMLRREDGVAYTVDHYDRTRIAA